MNVVRYVFEKGLEIYCIKQGRWAIQSSIDNKLYTTPSEICKTYEVRPILITERFPWGEEYSHLLSTNNERQILELTLSELSKLDPFKDTSTLLHSYTLTYVISGVCYHCKRLAEIYCEISRTFTKTFKIDKKPKNHVVFGGQYEPFHEFEALITNIRRSYQSMRHIIWRVFGPKKDLIPSSFEKVVSMCNNLPDDLEKRLNYSWSNYGIKAKDIRDCIQHYVPIGRSLPNANMIKLHDKVWSVTLYIPDNPEARSLKQFKYDNKIDALTYGWELTNEVIEVSQAIIRKIRVTPFDDQTKLN